MPTHEVTYPEFLVILFVIIAGGIFLGLFVLWVRDAILDWWDRYSFDRWYRRIRERR